jgi:chemotaxis-related protein WspB
MLFLLFQLGADRYALDASRVVEVLPLLELKPVPSAPRGVAGLFSYRGEPVPAVDLSQLILGRPAVERLTTRIILTHYSDAEGVSRRLGLIAENVTQVVQKAEADFREGGLTLGDAPYLGPMLIDDRGVVRRVREDRLLPNAVRDALFTEPASQ